MLEFCCRPWIRKTRHTTTLKGIFMLVSGFFRLPNDIPKPFWRYPVMYMSFHYWALQGQYQNDLKGLVFDALPPDNDTKIPGELILEDIFQIDVDRSKWVDLSVIFAMIIIYRFIFFLIIKLNETVTPWIRAYIARQRMQHTYDNNNNKPRHAEISLSPTLQDLSHPPSTEASSTSDLNIAELT